MGGFAGCRAIFSVISLVAFVLLSASLVAQDATPTPEVPEILFGLVPTDPSFGQYFEDVEMVPGESRDFSVSLVNVGTAPVELVVFSANAGVSPNGGFVPGTEDDERTGAALWVDFPTVTGTFAPDTQTDFAFSVQVPTDAVPGQYISALVAETVEALPIPGTDILDHKLQFSVSLSILVPGEMEATFEVGDPVWDRGYLAIPVANTGNYLVRPDGEITMRDSSGNIILTAPVTMGSVYAGLDTLIYVRLPDQFPAGAYSVDVNLVDPESGFSQGYDDRAFEVPEPFDPRGLSLASYNIQPNSEEIVFANVDVVVANGGSQLASVDVIMSVWLNGELVDEYPLARNQVLLRGENEFTTRYIPAEVWHPGTYNFSVSVSSVNPNGGGRIELLNEELDAEIVVP